MGRGGEESLEAVPPPSGKVPANVCTPNPSAASVTPYGGTPTVIRSGTIGSAKGRESAGAIAEP